MELEIWEQQRNFTLIFPSWLCQMENLAAELVLLVLYLREDFGGLEKSRTVLNPGCSSRFPFCSLNLIRLALRKMQRANEIGAFVPGHKRVKLANFWPFCEKKNTWLSMNCEKKNTAFKSSHPDLWKSSTYGNVGAWFFYAGRTFVALSACFKSFLLWAHVQNPWDEKKVLFL